MYIVTKALRDEFISGLRPGYARSLPSMMIGSANDILFGAKELYLSGTPFHNRGAGRQSRMDDPHILASILNPLCEKLWRYFMGDFTPKSQAEFDKFHQELCKDFLKLFEDAGFTHTYGNAQKFINVLFKYLSCYEDAPLYFEEKFKYCHMALDRYTYNGYRLPFYRDVVYPFLHKKAAEDLTAWSSLTESEYKKVTANVVSYVSKNPKSYNEYLKICQSLSVFTSVPLLENDYILTAFEAEFFLWAIAKRCQEKDDNDVFVYNSVFVKSIKALL